MDNLGKKTAPKREWFPRIQRTLWENIHTNIVKKEGKGGRKGRRKGGRKEGSDHLGSSQP